MRELIDDIDRWLADGEKVALATVIETWGSAPRPAGARLALTPTGRLAGSVSGGCVEGAVFEAGVAALAEGRPRLLHFGVADETAWDVGLACGGEITIFVEPLDRTVYRAAREILVANRSGALAVVIDGPEDWLGRSVVLAEGGAATIAMEASQALPVLQAVEEVMADGRSQQLSLTTTPEPISLFVDILAPAPALVIVGGAHVAIALTAIARPLGYRTVIVDPRRAFGSPERFAHADQLIQAWPHAAFDQLTLTRETAVIMLSHDPKIDDPALTRALHSPAFYIGALGSRRTHDQRLARLRAAGLAEAQLARIHAPIGLDINARTPEEIAVAIMAEIIAVRRQAIRPR